MNTNSQLLIGDIILVNGGVLASELNKLGQSLVAGAKKLKRVKSDYSHVAVSMGAGGFFHAEKNEGVNFIFIDDLLKKYPGEWISIRNKKLSKLAQERYEEVYKSIIYHIKKKYNNKFLKGYYSENIDRASVFCSQLAAEILEKHAIDIGVVSNKAFPVDFQKLLNTTEWVDVTKEYQEFIEIFSDDMEEMKRKFEYGSAVAIFTNSQAIHHAETYGTINGLCEALHNFSNDLSGAKKQYSKIPYGQLPIKYWNVKEPDDE